MLFTHININVYLHQFTSPTIHHIFVIADAALYYEESWRIPALPTGKLIDKTAFTDAIVNYNATFIICAGTQFNATAVSIALTYPSVKILLFSTLRQVLPPIPNLAFATGRMYEAMVLAGIIAASTSKTGNLGFIMSLNHPGRYVFLLLYI